MTRDARDDFEVVKDPDNWRSRPRWVIRHKPTGKFLATPVTVETWHGTIETTAAYHDRKRDAVAALEAYLARREAAKSARAAEHKKSGQVT